MKEVSKEFPTVCEESQYLPTSAFSLSHECEEAQHMQWSKTSLIQSYLSKEVIMFGSEVLTG